MNDRVRSFWRDESGGEMSDYALFLALVAVLLIAAALMYRDTLRARFGEAARVLDFAK